MLLLKLEAKLFKFKAKYVSGSWFNFVLFLFENETFHFVVKALITIIISL